jgi:hypothetical protein
MSSSLTARLSGTARCRRHLHARDFIDVSIRAFLSTQQSDFPTAIIEQSDGWATRLAARSQMACEIYFFALAYG